MTRKRKCDSKSNGFVAAAEQVCLQPVLEHRQGRGRSNAGSVVRLESNRNVESKIAYLLQEISYFEP